MTKSETFGWGEFGNNLAVLTLGLVALEAAAVLLLA